MLNAVPDNAKHRPFYVRRLIAQLSVFFVVAALILSLNPIVMAVTYFCTVTFFDNLLFYVFHMKSSDHVEADRLMAENEATPEQLDQYSASRRKIRLASFALAFLLGGIAYFVLPSFFLAVSCVGYLATTLALITYMKPHIKNKYPPAFVRDDRYYVPSSGPKMGHISPAQAALAAAGLWPGGMVDI